MAELILRPNADGTNNFTSYPSGSIAYVEVDEEVCDNDTTYVYSTYGQLRLGLPNHTTESGTINSVTLHVVAKVESAPYPYTFTLGFINPITSGTSATLTTTYAEYTFTSTWGGWTWDYIDSMLTYILWTQGSINLRVTQIWVTVDYTPPVPTITTEAATQIAYNCAMGNGTITSGTNATERGFGIFLEYGWSPEHPNSGTLSGYIDHIIAGFVGDVTWDIVFKWHGTLYKIETETGDFEEGEFSLVLGYPSVLGNPSSVFNDKLFKCEDYLYSAYAIIYGEVYTGDFVPFSTLCDSGGDQQPDDDISDGNPTEPIIPIDIPIDQPPEGYPPFEWEFPPEIPYPPWDWDLPDLPPWVLPDLPDYEIPDYPPQSFVGDFYYKKPYTKKDLDELRAKCIIYNKNSVEFALVLRHNMNVLREFFNMMTDYMGKDEFNNFTDLIPPQRLKELYLDNLEVNDFKDMINGFIRNAVDDNIAVNRNFSLIQEATADPQENNSEGFFTDIYSAMKTVTEDNPDVDTLKIVVDNLNQETASNFSTIMHNLEIVRARLL